MKVTIEIDCTPEEARWAMGMPDLSALHDQYLARLTQGIDATSGPEAIEALMRNWAPMGEAGMALWKTLFDQKGKTGG